MHRGVIHNRKRGTQVRDYSGLRFGNITPTDIDGYIEYHGRCHVLLELKLANAELPFGQRLALERLCDDLDLARPTIAIVASHGNVDGDIDAANATVAEVRYHGRWARKTGGRTVRDIAESFINWIDNAQ